VVSAAGGAEAAGASGDSSPARAERRLHVRKDKTNPRRIAVLALLLFAQPPGALFAAAGAALVLAAVAFHGWAAGYLARAGYVERKPELTVRGPYRHNRNPYYVAHLAMDLGFFCLAGLPYLFPLYLPVVFTVYRKWVIGEEPFLEREFGDDYRTYRANVPRWRVRLRPAPPQGPEQGFSWATFRRNRELSRSLAHLLLAGVFGLCAAFGNPAAAVDPVLRATALALIATWLLLHDVIPVGIARVSGAWLGATLAVVAVGAALLVQPSAAIWQRAAAPWSWLAVAVGSVLGAVAVLGPRDLLARPIVRWYAVALAIGCVSGTLGGVWAAGLAGLVLWMLLVAGVAPIDPGPVGTTRPKETAQRVARSSV
jgi:protein-S-isoprenylcysteine O-methyltransferase Ste14